MKEDVILHSDLNCFYAAVEMNEHAELRGRRIAVCGSTEDRHGIVLTASYPAKRSGVKTGMANWQARLACPDLIEVDPHYELYMRYSQQVRGIYRRYSDAVEPFGMDECWIGLHGAGSVAREGRGIAEEIRRSVREETGLTVSVGVSFSKVFAKLGSDMKKPDAVTVITRDDFRQRVWPLPVSELLYAGPATTRKLAGMNIHTIGELAGCDPALLQRRLGRNGVMLWRFAAGLDRSRVMPSDHCIPVKSVGHGVTCVRDLDNDYDIWRVIYELAQDVGRRLRACALSARGVQLTVRDSGLDFRQFQLRLPAPTRSPLALAQGAWALYEARWDRSRLVRALTVRGIDPVPADGAVQTDLFGDWRRRERQRRLDDAVDDIRTRFGYDSIRPAGLMGDLAMAQDKCETVPMPAPMFR